MGNTFLLAAESLKGRLLRKLATILLGNAPQFYCLMFCQAQHNTTNHNTSIYNASQNTELHAVGGGHTAGPNYLLCVIKCAPVLRSTPPECKQT